MGVGDAGGSEFALEGGAVCGVVGDGEVWVFELVSGEYADDAFVWGDETFVAELEESCERGAAGGFAAEAGGGDACAAVDDFLIADGAYDAVADIESSECFDEVYGAVDFDGGGES